jgi:adenylate cyclase
MSMTVERHSDFVDPQEPYRLGACVVNPATGEIQNGDSCVKLQPQAIKVLTYLTSRPNKVISRAEIEEAVWRGRVIGYDSLTSIIFKLRKALGDDPKWPHIIETISKRGYRLLVEPRPAEQPTEERTAFIARKYAPLRTKRSRATLLAMALLIVAAAIAAALLRYGAFANKLASGVSGAAQNAIVVLPFKSIDAPDGQNSIADGLTDDLTTALAKNGDLLVIARDSAFFYKDRPIDYQKIAARLKVNIILRGTVRHNGEYLRVNVQVIDAAKGNHLWAELFDGKTGDVFDLEERIVRAIIPVLTGRAAPKSKPTLLVRTPSTQAYRAFQIGRQHFYLYLNKSENAKARALFERAIKYDSHFAMARAMLAWTYAFDATNGWTNDRKASLQHAEDEANRAIAEAPEIPLSYFITGLVFRERKEYIKALVEAEKATALDPSYANAHVLIATLLYYAGRPAESIERLKKAISINPHHPYNYHFHLGQAYFMLHRYDNAIQSLRAGLASNPAAERLHVWLAASYAQAGMTEDARWEAEEVLSLNSEFSLSAIAGAFPFKNPKDRDHLVEGLRKAGLN